MHETQLERLSWVNQVRTHRTGAVESLDVVSVPNCRTWNPHLIAKCSTALVLRSTAPEVTPFPGTRPPVHRQGWRSLLGTRCSHKPSTSLTENCALLPACGP